MICTSRWSFESRLLPFLLLALATPSPAASQGATQVPVTGTPVPEALAATGNELEGELNCFELWFPSADVRAIVQNCPDMGAEFAFHMRTLAKYLFREVVLRADSTLAQYHTQGTLHGVEFDWFFPGPMPGSEGLPLAGAVDVLLTPSGADSTLLATVYGYDAAGYATKKALVEASVGHPMQTFVVFAGDVLTISSDAAPIQVGGDANEFFGPLWSGGGMEFSGTGNVVHGSLATAGDLVLGSGNEVALTFAGDLRPALAPPLAVEFARAQAQAQGSYYPGDCVLATGSLPAQGLVFAEGTITVAADGLAGLWTLVAATGDVVLQGDDLALAPGLAGLASIAYQGDVRVLGHNSFLTGEFHAPSGSLELAGSDNTLIGVFAGSAASVGGDGNVLSDGTETVTP